METTKEMNILLSTGMTQHDAKKHMKMGAIIYEVNDYLNNFNEYADALEEDAKTELRNFLKKGKDGTIWDNDLTTYEDKKYYIEYAL